MDPKFFERIQDYSLSNDDVEQIVGPIRFIKYGDLDDETYESIFRKRDQVVILFLTKSDSYGHWLALLKHPGDVVEVFDSYGLSVDGNRRWLTLAKNEQWDQRDPQILDLLKGHCKIVYNDRELQGDGVNTCGRHVAVRIMNSDMDLKRYYKLIEDSGKSADDFVTIVTYQKIKR
jgi:hypothetical protein